jgi:hypothetical protein
LNFLRCDLRDHRSNEDHEKYSCADQITSIFGIGIGTQHPNHSDDAGPTV